MLHFYYRKKKNVKHDVLLNKLPAYAPEVLTNKVSGKLK